jgi:hypothetical protein
MCSVSIKCDQVHYEKGIDSGELHLLLRAAVDRLHTPVFHRSRCTRGLEVWCLGDLPLYNCAQRLFGHVASCTVNTFVCHRCTRTWCKTHLNSGVAFHTFVTYLPQKTPVYQTWHFYFFLMLLLKTWSH